jgi:hypothetical protein
MAHLLEYFIHVFSSVGCRQSRDNSVWDYVTMCGDVLDGRRDEEGWFIKDCFGFVEWEWKEVS